MSAKHTPGPWIAGNDDDSDRFLVGPEMYPGLVGCPVVQLHDEANARLIAASPELLDTTAALLFVVRALANEFGIDPETTRFRFTANERSIGDIRLSDVYERADALVAKATGAAS